VASSFAYYTSLYFGAIFANLGIYLPFMPIWLSWRGMTAFEIAVLTSAPLLARVLATPLIGIWSDTRQDHRSVLIEGSWIAVASAFFLLFAHGFWSILMLILVLQLAIQSLIPLAEAKSLSGAQKLGLDYGRMRLWGSLAFIGANIIGGFIIASYGGGSVAVMMLATAIIIAIAAHSLPYNPEVQHTKRQNFRDGLHEARSLLSQRWFLLPLLAAGLIQSSHAIYYVFGALHWRATGISDSWIGILWALGVIIEAFFFSMSNRIVARVGAIGLIVIGGIGAMVRWTIMAFDPPFWALFPLQCLHALTFAATHLGTLHLIQTHVPPERSGAAQSANAALGSGILMGLTTFFAGLMYDQLAAASYAVMAGFAGLGLIFALMLPAYLQPAQSKEKIITVVKS